VRLSEAGVAPRKRGLGVEYSPSFGQGLGFDGCSPAVLDDILAVECEVMMALVMVRASNTETTGCADFGGPKVFLGSGSFSQGQHSNNALVLEELECFFLRSHEISSPCLKPMAGFAHFVG